MILVKVRLVGYAEGIELGEFDLDDLPALRLIFEAHDIIVEDEFEGKFIDSQIVVKKPRAYLEFILE